MTRAPLGNIPPSAAKRLLTEALPSPTWALVTTMKVPTARKMRMAPTLRQDAQNSNSPNALTLRRLTPTSSSSAAIAVSSTGTLGKKNWKYRPIAMSSAMPVMAQLMKYIQPDMNAPFLPNISPA